MSWTDGKTMQPRRGDIFFADLQDYGKERGCRPVIILQNNKGNVYSDSVIVATISSSKRKMLPTHVALGPVHGLKQVSTASLEDILTIRKNCLINYLGTIVNTKEEEKLNEAIRVSLGLKQLYEQGD